MSREFRAYFLTILFLIVTAFAGGTFLPANAAMLCGPRKQVIDGLCVQPRPCTPAVYVRYGLDDDAVFHR